MKFEKLKSKLMHYTWDIGLAKIPPQGILSFKTNDLILIKNPYVNKWFADPFILEEDKEVLSLLVEEYDSEVKRGRIAKIEVNKKLSTIVNCKIMLELSSHLSFPAVYKINNRVFVHPENSESGTSILYEYIKESDSLVPVNILSEYPLTDAVIYFHNCKYYMLSTRRPQPNGRFLDLYTSESFNGEYNYLTTVEFDSEIARNGGAIISANGRTMRISQDCCGGYGKGVVFSDFNISNDGIFYSKEIKRIYLHSFHYGGIHTFNTNSQWIVVDLKKFDYVIGNLLQYLKTLLKFQIKR